ncbi:MAG: tRNA (adenosine(37)-N6)-threonylcarbamoyltransferase complex dimerization subunit type 1 TsaB [Pyrinomonadaceae bacterium]
MSISERPLILSLETATRAGSIALSSGARIVAFRTGDEKASHSVNLLSDVQSVLKEAGAHLSDIDLFAAATGPGSFTGLRIGLATVKSFAATLARPCLGVSTLEAIAHAAGASRQTMAMIPAGRGEVFAQLLSVDEDGETHALGEAFHLAPQRLLERAKDIKSLKWAGEGARIHAEAIMDFARRNSILFQMEALEGGSDLTGNEEGWTLAPPTSVLAKAVAALALRRFTGGQAERPEDLRAIYVRPSDAELNEQCLEQRDPSG